MICVKQLVFFERVFNAGFGSVTARGAMLPGTAILESAVDAEVADWFGAADQNLVLVDLFRAYSAVVLHVDLSGEHRGLACPAHALSAGRGWREARGPCGIQNGLVCAAGDGAACSGEFDAVGGGACSLAPGIRQCRRLIAERAHGVGHDLVIGVSRRRRGNRQGLEGDLIVDFNSAGMKQINAGAL